MAEHRQQEEAVEELEAAIEAEENTEKNYHIRQALQLLELDGEAVSETGQRS
ncbi:hypothetical protein [Halorussus ruber]|uniref:hypothetical protein n=1 Tax=Halorussus ruber TaxID=1126238 RepID=UPI00143D1C7E|nr:hypothetical protein [Halorussus ruber]